MDQNSMMGLIQLFQIPGRPAATGFAALNFLSNLGFGPLGFGGGGGAPPVAAGDYVAILTAGGKTLRTTLRVERANTTGAQTSLFNDQRRR
jgi:hypothetical protein